VCPIGALPHAPFTEIVKDAPSCKLVRDSNRLWCDSLAVPRRMHHPPEHTSRRNEQQISSSPLFRKLKYIASRLVYCKKVNGESFPGAASMSAFWFYILLAAVELLILSFVGHFWYKAAAPNHVVSRQWRWTTQDSRDMWIDAAKTMITAAGIAAALVASVGLGSARPLSSPSLLNAKVATISLVACVCFSMALVLALSRGHEAAKSRNLIDQRMKGNFGEISEGVLSYFALAVILILGFLGLSCFFVGFMFLGRIVWNF